MARKCSICTHYRRHEIDKAIVSGMTYRDIAAAFGLSASAVGRHRLVHLPTRLTQAFAAREVEHTAALEQQRRDQDAETTRQALDVVQQLKLINTACLEVLKSARESKQNGMLLQSVDRIHRQIELQAKLLGELDTRPTVNVLVAPEWQEVRQQIFVALAPHPEARAAVARALEVSPGARP